MITYGSLTILQSNKPTPNHLSPHTDHGKKNLGITNKCDIHHDVLYILK